MMSELIRILYVDDAVLDRELVLDALEKEHRGISVTPAASRAEFESALQQGDFDLVLTDFNILGFEGLQVLEAVHAKYPDVPVILVTGTGSEEIAVEAMKRGAADYVIKTTKHIRRLPHTIHTALEKKRLLEKHRQAEERYRSIYENAVEGIYQSTPRGRFLSVNPAMARIYGYESPQEMIEQITSIESQIYVRSQDRSEFIRLLTEHGKVENFEAQNYRKDGSIIWVRSDARLVNIEGLEPYFEGFLSDITAHKQAEQAVQDSELRLESIVNSAMDAILIIDEAQNIVIFNPAAEHMFRCQSSDVIGRSLAQFMPPESRARHAAFVRKFGESGVTRRSMGRNTLPFSCLRADGDVFPGEISISQFEVSGQRFYTAIVRDVTEREQAEEAFRQAEQKYRNIFENAVEGIHQTTPEGKYISANPAAARILGYESPEELMSSVDDLNTQFYVEPGRREEFVALMELQNAVSNFESEVYRKDGSRVWVSENVHTVRDEHGNLLYYEGTTEDITERKRAQVALRESEARYRDIFDGVQEAIFVETLDGRILAANERACEMYGYSREELLTKTVADLVPKNHPILWVRDEQPALTTTSMESLNLRANGEIFPIEISGHYQIINGERVVLVVARDITERKRAEEKIKRQVEYLTALREIDQAITSAFDLQMSLNVLVSRALSLLKIDAVTVLLLNSVMNTLNFAAGTGFWTPTVTTSSVKLGESYAGKAALERRMVAIPDLAHEPNNLFFSGFLSGEKFVSYWGVPLTVKGKVIGVLEVFSRSIIERDQEWFDFLSTLAGQAAIAIDNARLFENLEISNNELNLAYEATIEGWSRALDLRDRETEGHTLRVTEKTLELARRMGLPDRELSHIRRGSLLHDIGKMGVPDSILLKADALTDSEWEIMRNHPLFAFQLLSPIRYLKSAAIDIPYCHHEKWDGTGYPRGLKAEQIPFAARIFAVVDVYDALTSDRPYRAAWPNEKVIEHIKLLAGTHFDPQVVQAFLMMIEA
jgi:PAS domain S-box-containing protein